MLRVDSVQGKMKGMWYYNCTCECGNKVVVRRDSLIKGKTQSCGCYNKKKAVNINKKHGMYNTRFYNIYLGMKNRCYNKNYNWYHRYGGRGIKVCDRWLGEDGFIHFKEDMYESYLEHCKLYGEEETTLERINVDGDYEANNCKWATNKEQSNNLSSNKLITYNGETLTAKMMLEKYAPDLNYKTFLNRLNSGWTVESALFTSTNSTIYRIYEYNGESLNASQLLMKYAPELSYTTFTERLDSGWSLEDALFTPPKEQINHVYEYNGEKSPLSEILRKFGDCRINYSLAVHRIYKGWSIERAINELPTIYNGQKVIQPFTFRDKNDDIKH